MTDDELSAIRERAAVLAGEWVHEEHDYGDEVWLGGDGVGMHKISSETLNLYASGRGLKEYDRARATDAIRAEGAAARVRSRAAAQALTAAPADIAALIAYVDELTG